MASPYPWLLQTTAGCVMVGIISQLLISITLSSRSLGQEERNTIPNSEKNRGFKGKLCLSADGAVFCPNMKIVPIYVH